MTLGLLHAVRMRDVVRAELAAPGQFAEVFDAVTEAELTPWYRATLDMDRDRQAAIDAIIGGRPIPPPADEGGSLRRALIVAAAYDADAYRAFLDIMAVLSPPEEVYARPGLLDSITAITANKPPLQVPGPTRQELLALVA
jgi:hypothetical protein